MRALASDIRFMAGLVLKTLSNYDRKMDSQDALMLILRTGAVGSGFRHLRQIGGPALGFFQMEPDTALDLVVNFLNSRSVLTTLIDVVAGGSSWRGDLDYHLASNIALQIALCRLKYWRVSAAIPAADDLNGQAKYWKEHYNTAAGKGTPAQFVAAAQQAGLDTYLWQQK